MRLVPPPSVFAFSLLALLLSAGTVSAQTGEISGTVTAVATGHPLPGVNVTIEGTRQGAATDAQGEYTITEVEVGTYTLVASFVGYGDEAQEGVEVQEGKTTVVDIAMQQEAAGLDEVVVIGYGEQQRRDLTGAVSSVSAEEVTEAPVLSVNEALQGRAAGVQVKQISGAPGGGLSVRIRGVGSITSSGDPLYVVDGVPVGGGEGGPSTGRGREVGQNALGWLNPNDIASIEVLKDASATAIYGSRGANGVVLITTKSGTSEQLDVSFEAAAGFQESTHRYDVLNARQFAEFANVYAENSALEQPFTNPEAFGEGTDWQDLIYRTAPTQNYNLSVRGGVADTRFALSGSFTQEEGIITGSDFERYSFRMNIDQALSDQVRVGGNLTATRRNSSLGGAVGGGGPRVGGATQSALRIYPVLPVRDENGNFTFNDVNTPAELQAIGLTGGQTTNPVAITREVRDRFQEDFVLGSFFLEYDIVEDLTFRADASAEVSNDIRNTFYPSTTREGSLNSQGGRAIINPGQSSDYLLEGLLSYNTALGERQNLDLTAGATYEYSVGTGTYISNTNFTTDITGTDDVGAGAPEGGPNVGSGRNENTLISTLGRVNYSFNDKYLVTVTGRVDGSSRFGANNKWGIFPSGALAWRLSEEPFIEDIDFLSNLKARVSYGVTGNQEIGSYNSLASLFSTLYNFDGTRVNAYAPGSIANPDLRWERSQQLDVGLDIGVLDNRISFTADYYRKRTDDLLLFVPLVVSSGFETALQNVGAMQNRGLEFSLGVDVLSGDVSWSSSANLATNANEVLDLGPRGEFQGPDASGGTDIRGGLVREGQPLGIFFGFETDGIYRDQAEVDAGAQPDAVPGDRRFVDTNGDGEITFEDRTILGNPYPDFTFGWSNRFGYGPLSLSVLIQGAVGNEIINTNLLGLVGENAALGDVPLGANILAERFTDRWTPENRDAKYPRIGALPVGAQPPTGDLELQSWLLEDGSYLRLNSVRLGYTLPAGLFGGVTGLQQGEVYVSVKNAFTLTDYSGANPEVNTLGANSITQGVDQGAYPLARVYRLGVRLNF